MIPWKGGWKRGIDAEPGRTWDLLEVTSGRENLAGAVRMAGGTALVVRIPSDEFSSGEALYKISQIRQWAAGGRFKWIHVGLHFPSLWSKAVWRGPGGRPGRRQAAASGAIAREE